MSGISLVDLPPRYRQQALEKLAAKKPKEKPSRSKYHNEKTERDGISFDSRKEARRYDELMLMLAAGEISDLRLQVDFTLQEAYTTPQGERIRAIRYKADFVYWRRGEKIVEDVKSKPTKTKVYAVKKKMMAEKYGLQIKEV